MKRERRHNLRPCYCLVFVLWRWITRPDFALTYGKRNKEKFMYLSIRNSPDRWLLGIFNRVLGGRRGGRWKKKKKKKNEEEKGKKKEKLKQNKENWKTVSALIEEEETWEKNQDSRDLIPKSDKSVHLALRASIGIYSNKTTITIPPSSSNMTYAHPWLEKSRV